jgi:hypothetical protein
LNIYAFLSLKNRSSFTKSTCLTCFNILLFITTAQTLIFINLQKLSHKVNTVVNFSESLTCFPFNRGENGD